jgi:predicted HTH transcriptional regulator
MTHYIKKLISEGEHQQLDFKFEVSDYQKIARTLAAFANTDGGRLLIGVKDNGAIAGVRSAEEYYMIEGASRLYCRPEVSFTSREWNVEGRSVLEIMVAKGDHGAPHHAPDKDGKWKVYIRKGDQNLVAHPVLLKVWKRESSPAGTYIKFTEKERALLRYLEEYEEITIGEFQQMLGIPKRLAVNILVNFVMLKLIRLEIDEDLVWFTLNENYKDLLPESEK